MKLIEFRKQTDSGHSGFSLVEALIAFSLLVVSLAGLLVTFQGVGKETNFTDEHYSAMFLAQKVLEDINNKTIDNPHFFSELIHAAEGEEKSVVNGCSPYFQLLENTVNFDRLLPSEDLPIATGPLFEQLKNYSVQVSSAFVEDPATKEPYSNLRKVKIKIRWKSKDNSLQDYEISQFINGIDEEEFKKFPEIFVSTEIKKKIADGGAAKISELLEGQNISEYIKTNPGADAKVIQDLGEFIYFVRETIDKDAARLDEIQSCESDSGLLISSPDPLNNIKAAELLKKIARMYEDRTLSICYSFLLLRDYLNGNLAKAFAEPVLIGKTLSSSLRDLSFSLEDISDLSFQVPLALAAAERSYLRLINSPFVEIIPKRKEPDYLKKAIDIEKLGLLEKPENNDSEKQLGSLRKTIGSIEARFIGHHPNFTDYLRKEKEICQDQKTFRNYYSGIVQYFEYVGSIPAITKKIIASIPPGYIKK
ncbi:MAG: hypothetical protein HQM09_18095 [Candidatus Riflebacteria bacterium]|nr:hypothetical protein [Candidatus Riflebacteria bacterium]